MSRSGSLGAMAAEAVRRRRRLTSVMVCASTMCCAWMSIRDAAPRWPPTISLFGPAATREARAGDHSRESERRCKILAREISASPETLDAPCTHVYDPWFLAPGKLRRHGGVAQLGERLNGI